MPTCAYERSGISRLYSIDVSDPRRQPLANQTILSAEAEVNWVDRGTFFTRTVQHVAQVDGSTPTPQSLSKSALVRAHCHGACRLSMPLTIFVGVYELLLGDSLQSPHTPLRSDVLNSVEQSIHRCHVEKHLG